MQLLEWLLTISDTIGTKCLEIASFLPAFRRFEGVIRRAIYSWRQAARRYLTPQLLQRWTCGSGVEQERKGPPILQLLDYPDDTLPLPNFEDQPVYCLRDM